LWCDGKIQGDQQAAGQGRDDGNPIASEEDIRACQAWARLLASLGDKLGLTPTARARLARKKALGTAPDPDVPEDGYSFWRYGILPGEGSLAMGGWIMRRRHPKPPDIPVWPPDWLPDILLPPWQEPEFSLEELLNYTDDEYRILYYRRSGRFLGVYATREEADAADQYRYVRQLLGGKNALGKVTNSFNERFP
jgi:hypothetical protein